MVEQATSKEQEYHQMSTQLSTQTQSEPATSPLKLCLSFPKQSREVFYGLGSPQVYPASTELFRQSSAAHDAYFIDEGLVKLTYVEEDGQEFIVGLRTSGSILGAASVILNKAYPVSAVLLTRCTILRVPAKTFLGILESDDQFSQHLLREHSREVYDQVEKLVGLGCHSARHRFEQLLWNLSSELQRSNSRMGVRIHLRLPLKQWEVAQLISVTPQHLSKLIRQMQQEGVIRRENGWLIVFALHKRYHTARNRG